MQNFPNSQHNTGSVPTITSTSMPQTLPNGMVPGQQVVMTSVPSVQPQQQFYQPQPGQMVINTSVHQPSIIVGSQAQGSPAYSQMQVFSQGQAMSTQQSPQPIIFSQTNQQSPAPPPSIQTTSVVQQSAAASQPMQNQQQQQHQRMNFNQSPQQLIINNPAQPSSEIQPQNQAIANFSNPSGPVLISTPTPPPSTTPSMAPPNVVISSNPPGPAASSSSLPGNGLFDSKRLIELVQEVDPSLQIDEDVEDVLLQLADEFIEQVANKACQLAKHRGSSTLDAKDIQLTLERDWHYYVPGYAAEEVKTRKSHVTEAHRQRMAIIKQQMTGKK